MLNEEIMEYLGIFLRDLKINKKKKPICPIQISSSRAGIGNVST